MMLRAHVEFNHAGVNVLNRMVREGKIRGGAVISGIDCDACAKAKARRAPHSKQHPASYPVTKPGSVMQFDIFGPLPACRIFGYTYVMVGTDTATGAAFAHFMRNKTQVDKAYEALHLDMKKMSPFVEQKYGHEYKLEHFMADKDSNFTTVYGHVQSKFDEILARDRVAVSYTPGADVPELNGKVEAFQDSMKAGYNTLIEASGLPRESFAFAAIAHWVHTYNRLPTKANKLGNGEAPYATLGVPFSLTRLVGFGAKGYYWKPATPKGTGPNGHPCRVVGYYGAGYRVFDEVNNTIFSTVNVKPTRGVVEPMSMAEVVPGQQVEVRGGIDVGREEWQPTGGPLEMEVPENGAADEPRQETGAQQRQEAEVELAQGPEPDPGPQQEHDLPPNSEVDSASDHRPAGRRRSARKRGSAKKKQKNSAASGAREPSRIVRMGGNRSMTKTVGAGLNTSRTDLRGKGLSAAEEKELVAEAREHIRSARMAKAVVRFEQRNPKRKDTEHGPTKSWYRYEHYKKCNSVAELDRLLSKRIPVTPSGSKERAMLPADLEWDLIRGFCQFEFYDDDARTSREQEFVNMMVDWAATTSMTQAGVRKSSAEVDFPAHLSAMAAEILEEVPEVKNLKQVQQSDFREQWSAARRKELLGLKERGVWEEVPRSSVPHGAKVFPIKEVYSVVYTEQGGRRVVKKFKHRVTFRGDRQAHERDYFETSSTMAKTDSVRAAFALAASLGFDVYHADFTQAFTNSLRERECFMELPEMTAEEEDELGMIGRSKKYVGKLHKVLYGEKDSARAWERTYSQWLTEELGATVLCADKQVYVWRWNGEVMIMPVHVDDGVIVASSPTIKDEFMRRVSQKFAVTGGDQAEVVLGISVRRNKDQSFTLHQQAFAQTMVERFEISQLKDAKSPLPPGETYTPHTGEPIRVKDYMLRLGSLNWLACNTRPDLAYAASRLARAAKNPGPADHEAMEHVLRYVKHTVELGLTYHSNPDFLDQEYSLRNKLVGAVDSNFTHNGDKATSGSVSMLNGGAVSWRSTRQSTVTTSSTHAEVVAAAEYSKQLVWMRQLLAELGVAQFTTRVVVDNKAACDQPLSGKELKKTQHYRNQQAWLEQCVRQGDLWLDHIPGDDNPADIFTKATSVATFIKMRDVVLGITPWVPPSVETRKILQRRRDDYVFGRGGRGRS